MPAEYDWQSETKYTDHTGYTLHQYFFALKPTHSLTQYRRKRRPSCPARCHPPLITHPPTSFHPPTHPLTHYRRKRRPSCPTRSHPPLPNRRRGDQSIHAWAERPSFSCFERSSTCYCRGRVSSTSRREDSQDLV